MARALLFAGLMAVFLTGCVATKPRAKTAPVGPVSLGPHPSTIKPNTPPPPPPPVVVQTPAPRTAAPPRTARAANVPGAWRPTVKPRDWKFIVVHHSATPAGSARAFDREHKAKGWDELGYHFVIGNGSGAADGLVEIGPRWRTQKWGAHAKTADNRYNEQGIGICLVGNFEVSRPTPRQMAALAQLVAWLQVEYQIPDTRVLRHGDTKPTACPGRFLNMAQLRQMTHQRMTALGGQIPADVIAQRGDRELLRPD